MLSYKKLIKHPKHLHRLTGLTVAKFEQVLNKFQISWNMYIGELAKNPDRKRKFGAGRHPVLENLEDKLLFILVYVHMHPLLFLQGKIFAIEEGNTSIWIHRLLPLLDQTLGATHKRPTRKHKGRNLKELLRDFPKLKELEILGYEVTRPVRKPKDDEKY